MKHVLCLIITICFCMNVALAVDHRPEARIQPWKENPRYWQYRGKPILLLGASDEDNLFNNPALLDDNFQKMKACGANYIRSTLSIRDEGNAVPYLKKDGLYDLNAFNPDYWKRLEDSVKKAYDQDTIVQIEIWATFDHYRDYWLVHPFNPKNNSVLTEENTKLKTEWPHHPAQNPQPFFFSIPQKNNDKLLLKYQEAFVRKVLDVTLPYPNVLYCLDNETRAPVEWAHYWGAFIKDESQKRGLTAQLTEMWDAWDLHGEEHERTYKHPEYFSYVDVSQNNWQIGQTHYDRLMWYRGMIAQQPGGIRPMNNVKVYQRQGGNLPNDPAINVDRWIQNVFAGCASTRFHRPTGGIGISPLAMKIVRATRTFTDAFDIFHTEPNPDLLGSREDNEAYCLAGKDGKTYALYFPNGGSVALTVKNPAKDYTVRWFDIETAKFLDTQQGRGSDKSIELSCPKDKQIRFVLVERVDE